MTTDLPGGLQEQLEYLLRNGATHDFAPDLGADILDQIDAFLGRYVAYPDEGARQAHTLWIAHCWFMDCWYATPRLMFMSPEAGSGKTRALTITQHLVPYPDLTADLSPAYLFHSIDQSMKHNGARPTMLYDELDTVFGSEATRGSAQMRRLINAGHDKNATVNRVLGKRGAVKLPIYSAMALAGKMDVFDLPSTIRTRSVIIKMQRRSPDEKVDRWDRRSSPIEAERLRDLLQFWAEFVHDRMKDHIPDIPERIQDRDADVWEPLLSIADMAGGHWPGTARVTGVKAVNTLGVNATPSPGMQLLWDIKAIFDDDPAERIFTPRLLSELQGVEESRWSSLTAIKMSQLLRPYGIQPKLLRIAERVGKGYEKDYFSDAWRRYPPPAPFTPFTPFTKQNDDE